MIRVYLLPVENLDGTEQVAGIEIIHDALLLTTADPDTRKLIMDTSDLEHAILEGFANAWWEAYEDEIQQYNEQVEIIPPDPDTIRAEELLATSPAVISMPEMWELMRIFGRRHGYRF